MMKKSLLILTSAVFVLAGCQDDQAPEPTTSTEQFVEIPADVAVDEVMEEQVSTTDDGHSANIALDWNGTYVGILPCADCEGIETEVTLNHDGSYSVSQTYLGKENGHFESQGQLSWNEKGSIITLENETGANQYFVGENILFKLDMNGERVSGDLAEHYQLRKQ